MNAEQKQALIDEIVIQALRDDVCQWKQRAETSEAKLAEQEKRKPDFHVRQIRTVQGPAWIECGADYQRGRHLFTRPAPAVSLVELVPPEMTNEMAAQLFSDKAITAVDVWNTCRAAILRNIKEVAK